MSHGFIKLYYSFNAINTFYIFMQAFKLYKGAFKGNDTGF
jgi:hypothetical protein